VPSGPGRLSFKFRFIQDVFDPKSTGAMAARPVTTRFAPSPTGYLHLGTAYSALVAERQARDNKGTFLLRIEDIDDGRCRAEFEGQMLDDLGWLGLTWEEPVRRQSEHLDLYRSHLTALIDQGLAYRCFCTRKEIADEVANMPSAPHGPEGALYPGTCKRLSEDAVAAKIALGKPFAWRLDCTAAMTRLTQPLTFTECGRGPGGETGIQVADPAAFGDIVLGRKDVGVSYHLAVTVDDALQGVTLVTRGEDLFAATSIQRLLQKLLGLDTPDYFHHRLILHESGRRLAKRDQDVTLKALREAGVTPDEIRQRLGLTNR